MARQLNRVFDLPVPEDVITVLMEFGFEIYTQAGNYIELHSEKYQICLYHTSIEVKSGEYRVVQFANYDLSDFDILYRLDAFRIINLSSHPDFKTILQDAIQDYFMDNHQHCGTLHGGNTGAFFPKRSKGAVLGVGAQA